MNGYAVTKKNHLHAIPYISEWYQTHVGNILPYEDIPEIRKNAAFYDTLCALTRTSPYMFIKPMYYMTEVLQDKGKNIQIFPKRKSLIHQHIQIDTTSMLDLLVDKGS